IFQHRVEYRLQFARRAADHTQHLGGCRLLLQRLGEFLLQLGVPAANGINVRSRLRSSRTKLAAAWWALFAFEEPGHLVGTATGPVSSGQPRIEPVNPNRTAR